MPIDFTDDGNLFEPEYQVVHPARNLALNEKIREMKAAGQDVYNGALGQSPFPIPQTGIDALAKHANENLYEAVLGIKPLREKIIKLHAHQPHFSEERCIVSPGCKEAAWLLFHVLKTPIFIASPTWVAYEPCARASQKRVVWVDTTYESKWKITPDALRCAFEKKPKDQTGLWVLINPDNPTGQTYTQEELSTLAEICRAHKVMVLSDEIYSLLAFDVTPGTNLTSMADVYPEGTIVASGLSKWASAGGWRLGYQLYPKELEHVLSRVKAAASWSYSCVAAPIQYAAIELMDTVVRRDCDYVRKASIILCAVADYLTNKFNQLGIRCHNADSAFYLLPDFEILRSPRIQSGQNLTDLLLAEAQIVMVEAGPCFGRPAEELTTRIAYIDFDGAAALASFELDHSHDVLTTRQYIDEVGYGEAFVEKACPNLYESMKRLWAWIENEKKALDFHHF